MSRIPLDQVTSMPNGTQQSPIDIVTKDAIAVQWPSTYLSVEYAKGGRVHGTIDGRNFLVDHLPRLVTRFGGKRYRLARIHFHDHCEHHIDGKAPAVFELHLVHCLLSDKDKDMNDKLVIAAFFDTVNGKTNKRRRDGFRMMDASFAPTSSGKKQLAEGAKGGAGAEVVVSDIADFLPDDLSKWFTYQGSLTSYPFTEDVTWVVIQEKESIPESDVKELRASHAAQSKRVYGLQPLNRRYVLHLDGRKSKAQK